MMESSLKFSNYLVVSDVLNTSADRILFSTRTSQAIQITSKIYDGMLVNGVDRFPEDVLEKLKEAKILVNSNENELLTIIKENKEVISKDEVLYEVIQPSAMCQFGCPYCGQSHKKEYLSRDHYKNLITRIENKIKLGSYKTLYIGWFGGEPLMGLKQMREVTPLLLELAAKYNLKYGAKIVTNGMSLKVPIFEELVRQLKINFIEVTLDGAAEYHDAKRYLKGGGDTFDIVFGNILAICNKEGFEEFNCNINIRCNVDRLNINGVTPLIELLAEHKLQRKIASFYPIGIYSWAGNDAHKTSLSKEEFAELQIDWTLLMIKHGFNISLLPGRVNKVCLSVGHDSEMYDAYGNIFNCTEVSYTSFYEKTDYVLGNLSNPLSTPKVRPLTDWNDDVLNNKFPCTTCNMLPVCGGGCPKSWHEDMRACPPNKFNIKEKLALSYIVSKMDMEELENEIMQLG